MSSISVRKASEIYEAAAKCEIARHYVEHPALSAVSRQIKNLTHLVDADDEEFARRVLGPIRRAAFTLCSTPVPFVELAAELALDWSAIERLVRQAKQIYPDAHVLAESVVAGLKDLFKEPASPLLEPIESLIHQHGRLSVVLRNQRFNLRVAAFFADRKGLRRATVVSAAQLKGTHQCETLVAIGPSGWFPEYVFTAPRATAIHIVSYRWIRDTWKPAPVLLQNSDRDASARRVHCIGAMPKIRDGESSNGDGQVDPLDLLPNFAALVTSNRTEGSEGQPHAEIVSAKLCRITGDRAVFVAADDGASVLVIDTRESGSSAVRRVLVEDLEPGLFLLLRTSGGGDFIAPLADKLLGKLASSRREQQAEWKRLLIGAANARFGLRTRRVLASMVCDDLRAQAWSEARPGNVHYWMASKCIRPRKRSDFEGLLKFCGIANRSDELWSAMGDIDRAHRRAGHLIRRMLLQKIRVAPLDILERDGTMVFDLGDDDGGSLTAYEINDIVRQVIEVPAEQIGIPVDFGE